jgi:septal ring-binding cell division protein DamX
VHPPDELERLLLLGEHWLAAQDAETYTIQFQPAVEVQDLNRSLNSLSKLIDSDQVFVYRTRASTKPAVALAYGVYPSLGGALDAIGRLPPELSQHDPAPRTIRAIRAERLGVHAGVAYR